MGAWGVRRVGVNCRRDGFEIGMRMGIGMGMGMRICHDRNGV
jgi:hypothetical protein